MHFTKFTFLMALAALIVAGCKPKPKDPVVKYASTELKVRKEASPTAEQVDLLVTGKKVMVVEEVGEPVTISGATGKWARIEAWNGRIKGFVFGGFLSDKPVKYDLKLAQYDIRLPYTAVNESSEPATCRMPTAYVYKNVIIYKDNCAAGMDTYCKVTGNEGDEVSCDQAYKLPAVLVQELSSGGTPSNDPPPDLAGAKGSTGPLFRPVSEDSFKLGGSLFKLQ